MEDVCTIKKFNSYSDACDWIDQQDKYKEICGCGCGAGASISYDIEDNKIIMSWCSIDWDYDDIDESIREGTEIVGIIKNL